jgi:hypothetical protein
VSRQAGQEPEDDPVGQNEAIARSNAFFAALASRPDLLDESSRFFDRTHDPFARAQADEHQHPISADERDSPIPHGANNAPNIANAPPNNDANPKNLAGANPNAGAAQGAGAGQGPGGVSTPNPSGGGGGGGGGGTPAGGNLATLAMEGAFANPSLGNASGHGATMTPQIQTNVATNALTPGGDPPIAFNEGVENSPVIVATFSDADGNTDPSQYTANINWGNGQITTGGVMYNSSNGQFEVAGGMTYAEEGNYPITVTINDSDGNQTTATATAAVADAALTSGYSYPISATAAQEFSGPFGEFTDANTNAPASDFTASINWGDGNTSTGTVTAQGNGVFLVGGSHTYATAGTYPISVTINDDGGSQTTANTSATVTGGSSSAPVANNDNYSLSHDTNFSVNAASGVLTNDTDPNNLPLSAVLVSAPSDGVLNLNSDGSFTYTPNAHWIGTDSFTYQATDGQQNSNTATVSLNVQDTGTISTQPASYSVQQGQVLSVDASTGVLANASDSDGDSLTATLTSGPSNGTLQFNNDGSFTYTPNAGYVGNDSFSYTASDGVTTSMPTTVTIGVTNTAPTAVNQTYGVPENTTANVTAAAGLLNGASDADGDSLTASAVTQPSDGTVAVNSDGSFTYTPNTGYTGSDSFTYAISDGAASTDATVTLNVHADSTRPTANAASYSIQHDQTLTETAAQGVLAYASDSDGDLLTASLVSGPSNGTLTLNPDGSFTYTPNAGWTGSDSFQYAASDGKTSSTPAIVTLSVTNTGLPVANADSYSVERNNQFSADASIGVLTNDSDSDGDTLTASLVSGPSDGTLTLNSDGSFDYTPNSNFTGSDSFTYTASDDVASSSPATVTLTVSASAPSAADQSFDVAENNTLNAPSGALLLNAGNPDNMTLTAQDVTQPTDGSVTVNSDGSFVYTPTSNFTGSDSFTYDLADSTGLTSTPATVSINVNAGNTAPTASDLSYSVQQNTSLSTDSTSGVLTGASDSDGDKLYATLVSGPSDGTLSLSLDGSFTYTPNNGYYGTDSFQYEAFDGTLYSSPATVTLTVTEDVPTAANDSYSVLPTGTTSVTAANGVLANDSDPNGATLTASLLSAPSYGSVTLNGDGSFSYTPNSNFMGSDSFTYEAYNGTAYSSPATVTLTDGPVALAQSYSINHDTPLTVDSTVGLLTGAYDADGDSLTASLATGPSDGMVMVNSDGSFTYTPNTHFVGTDSFTYTVSDGTQTSAPATVTISVTNNTPSAADASYTLSHDQTLTVPASSGVLANDSDSDGDSPTAKLLSGPSHGMLQLASNGSFTYTPNARFAGRDSFTYEASDGVSTSAPATVFLYVTNAAPVAPSDYYSTPAGQALTVPAAGVLANAVDPDGDPLTAQLVTGPANGTLTLNSDGSFTYTPNPGFSGNDSFMYQASDGITTSSSATVTITVSSSPVANNDEFATGMNQTLSIAGPGVLWNDVAPSGQTLTAVLNTGPADGTLALNSDGSFTYTPNAGYTGNDSFTYYASAAGVLSAAPATVTLHVANVSLAMPQGPWVPINANDDNKSPVTNMIPAIRDYNYLRQLPGHLIDPQLQPLNITINNPNPLGFVDLEIQQVAGATGQIRLWSDDRKTSQITPGIYPVVGPNALPATIYVEGVNPTSRTIVANAIQSPPVPDNTITLTYFMVNPAMPGGGIPVVPVGQAQVSVGVTPVTQIFTINNEPVPPNPPVNPKTAGRIDFRPAPARPPGVPANSIFGGYETYGVNPDAQNPNAAVLGQFAATFNAQVFNANMPGGLHFIQNETITNGGGGSANAWTYAAGGPAAENWEWWVNGAFENAARNPRLDMAGQQSPGPQQPPYYQAQAVPVLGTNVGISAGDSPTATGLFLVARGLSGNNRAGSPVTRVAWTFNFTLYLVWSMPQGGGILGDVIYTLATRPWSVTLQATASVANGWADTIARPASGVFTPGDFSSVHPNPVVTGPTANQAAYIN